MIPAMMTSMRCMQIKWLVLLKQSRLIEQHTIKPTVVETRSN